MKKQMILFAVALMSAMAAISCTGGFESEEYGFSGSIALEEGRTDTLTVDIRMEYPAKGMSAQAMESLRDIITAEAFGNGYCGKAPQEAIDAYASDYISTYRDENLELAESLAGENSMALSWGKYITGAFTGEMNMADGDRLMNYTITDYSYTGGAHGMNTETNLVFDMKTGDQVLSEDIFTEESADILPGLLMKHVASAFDADILPGLLMKHVASAFDDPSGAEYLLVSEILPSDNLRITEDGITFIYNPYEIAAYAAGTIRITIPWDELQDILR